MDAFAHTQMLDCIWTQTHTLSRTRMNEFSHKHTLTFSRIHTHTTVILPCDLMNSITLLDVVPQRTEASNFSSDSRCLNAPAVPFRESYDVPHTAVSPIVFVHYQSHQKQLKVSRLLFGMRPCRVIPS